MYVCVINILHDTLLTLTHLHVFHLQHLLSFEPPLYAVSVILGSSIVIYMLFGAPDVSLYLPVSTWSNVNIDDQFSGPCLCCKKRRPRHKHIMSIMDQVRQEWWWWWWWCLNLFIGSINEVVPRKDSTLC